MKKILVLICSIAVLTASGCTHSKEISRIAFVISAGFDVDSCTFQIVKPSAFSGDGGESSPLLTKTIPAPNMQIAMDKLDASLSEECDFSHIKLVVFSSEKLYTGIGGEIQALTDSGIFHPGTRVAMCNGRVSDYMENLEIPLDTNPAEFFENFLSDEYSQYSPDITLRDLKSPYNSHSFSTVLPVMGESPAMGVLKDCKLCATLGERDILIYNLITKRDFNRDYISGDNIFRISKSRCHKGLIFKNGIPHITVKLSLSVESQSTENPKDILEKDIGEFLNRCSREYGADIAGFSQLAATHYLTITQWEKEDWQALFEKAQYSVKVHITTRQKGIALN